MKRDKVLYIEEKPVSARKKKRRRYRFFNILMLVLAAYFVVTIARQEFELREIQRKRGDLLALWFTSPVPK